MTEPKLQELRPLAGWARYDRWIEPIADALFDAETRAGRPVYLDLEQEVLDRLGARLMIAPEEVVSALARDVRLVSDMDSNHAFEAVLRRHLRWRRTDVRSTPPALPLLAVFSLAAEQMGETDGISPTNYYARLVHLLDGETTSVAASYREVAERLWGGLNLWLERNDGAHGLPTAFALGHRHVGLAVSQALVRDADRQRLRSFFLQFDLPPRSVIPPAELEVMLDVWINSLHSGAGASLTKLWRISINRSVICEIAATELAEWTGALSEAVPGRRVEQRARLMLTRAPGLRERISLFAVVPDCDGGPAAELASSTGGSVAVPLEPFREGLALLGESDTFSHEDLLEGLLALRIDGVGEVRRTPRRVVVLKHDDLSGTWIESVRVLLGDTLRLLVHRDRLEDVRRALAEMARPGWSERTEIAGLPENWIEFSDVEVFGRPITPIYSSSDLIALVPATSRQLQLAGGVKVPGRVRNRWHVRRAPELRAVSDAPVGFTIRLLDLGVTADESVHEVQLGSWTSDESNSVVVDLGTCELAVGEYALVMQEEGSKDASQRLTFSLRSSAAPDALSQHLAVPVMHSWGAPLAVVGADSPGAQPVTPDQYALKPLEPRPWWRFALREQRAAAVGLSRPPQDSCYYTGKHRERLDTVQLDRKGRPVTSTTIGRCAGCGAERVYSNDYWKLRRTKERADEAAAVAAMRSTGGTRPPVRVTERTDAGWDIALDLLVYFGGGDFELLRKISSEIADGTTFALQFARALEGLGHISIRRDPQTMAPASWHVDPRRYVVSGGAIALLGAWTATDLDEVSRTGAKEMTDSTREIPPLRQYEGMTAADLDGAVTKHAQLIERPAEDLLAQAARLSQVLPELRRVPAPSTLSLERFDPPSASWLQTVDGSARGAYRTVGRKRSYYLRTEADLRDGTAAVVDPYTAKHVAAVMLSGRALAAYHEPTHELICPVGAELPMLYDRAVVTATQRPAYVRRGYLVYSDVPPEVAARIGYLLTR